MLRKCQGKKIIRYDMKIYIIKKQNDSDNPHN